MIYAQGLPATLALRQQATTIPIVFTQVIDPVGFKLADSLGHPGGNVTGFVTWDFAIGGKWMELLRELDPKLTRVAILFNPDTAPYAPGLVAAARDAASGIEVVEMRTHNDGETEVQLEALGRAQHTSLLIIPEPFTNGHRDHIVARCAHFRVPTLNSARRRRWRGADVLHVRMGRTGEGTRRLHRSHSKRGFAARSADPGAAASRAPIV